MILLKLNVKQLVTVNHWISTSASRKLNDVCSINCWETFSNQSYVYLPIHMPIYVMKKEMPFLEWCINLIATLTPDYTVIKCLWWRTTEQRHDYYKVFQFHVYQEYVQLKPKIMPIHSYCENQECYLAPKYYLIWITAAMSFQEIFRTCNKSVIWHLTCHASI